MGRDWLGTGIAFPLRPGGDGRLSYVTQQAVVRQAITTILDTEPGEPIMLPAFGCALHQYLMQPNSAATRAAIRDEVTWALSRWEPRIRVTDVAVTPGDDPTLIWPHIAMTVLNDCFEAC